MLLPVRSVGVMGDARTFENVCALRPHDLLARISNRIINEVNGINRMVYDITSKPPGTIEWE